ncbi:CDP-alcohol phosphatidyltransferase family protein [Candidatus Borrarchaeum sp.]|uniref:CDP-alcohol phosphatidyltransferase family protein n=1 Tax=Candidatus Borrarchaeum sp. TaxID=2846742 RepID=UPI002580B937|nr:CDP-alcohol phosphatidyltransferase family protein [Candidatus Borrarchaeum sp.]
MANLFTEKWIKTFIPYGVALLRAFFAPFLFYTFINDLRIWTIILFFFACFTDYFDGYLVRKLDIISPSSLESYLDATADFIIIFTMFFAFMLKQIYPYWILIIIGVFFLQFVITSGLKSPVYDPVGKYTGLFFFVVIIITLLFPQPIVYNVLLICIIGFTAISVLSRSVYLITHKKDEPFIDKSPSDLLARILVVNLNT